MVIIVALIDTTCIICVVSLERVVFTTSERGQWLVPNSEGGLELGRGS